MSAAVVAFARDAATGALSIAQVWILDPNSKPENYQPLQQRLVERQKSLPASNVVSTFSCMRLKCGV